MKKQHQLHKKLISEKNYERQLQLLDHIFKDELEILDALEKQDFRRINGMLLDNLSDNLECLERKLGIK